MGSFNLRVKVTFITPSLSGGAEKNIVNIINLLDRSKFDITLIVCGRDLSYLSLLPQNIKFFFLKRENVRSSLPRVFKILYSSQPDIVYTTANQLSIPVRFFKMFTFSKFIDIARIPSLPSNNLGQTIKDKILKKFEGFVYRRVDCVVAQSIQMADEIRIFHKVNEKRIRVIQNPVDKELVLQLANRQVIEFCRDDFNIVAVGTLYSIKGFDLLIQSINILKQSIPNIKLHILGKEGIELEYGNFLKSLVSNLNLGSYIVFHGYQINPFSYIKDADLFVLSSRKEGFPNVVLEALTIGTPVVVTNCVDFTGIIEEGVNGVIVEKESVEALAEGVLMARGLEKKKFIYKNFDFNNWFNEFIINI